MMATHGRFFSIDKVRLVAMLPPGASDKTIGQHAGRRDYLSDLHAFYKGARDFSKNVPYLIDLTEIFDTIRNCKQEISA